MNVIALHASDLAIASCLVLLCAAISLVLRLNLQKQILWSATRTIVQLLLVGQLLRVVFTHASAGLTLLIITVMMALAIREVAVRPKARLQRHGNLVISAMAVASATLICVFFITNTAVEPTPWYDPRYVVALVGIVLGSALNAASLALDTMLTGATRERLAIEARISLGAPARQAFAGLLRESVRRGIVPSINQMAAAGIITLPGIMTGQILAGMDPSEAAKYQILLMFLLCGASTLAAMGAAFGAMRHLSDERGRLRLDRLRNPS
ncbi:ABC transporter permease [Bordetella sp. 02P26C-1]|uniref:ABC transporter permease n=1 Tax=Bordetella sp. 02P26C-1 TaxID=2683195 RepID=UPI001355B2F8|nr:iron export ABC transporter permease subunit FetB [Bordetella sp. 02P26C-1]MVW78029.1 iron export ABC transporter permease subunit FetB [Bordetella sp. 02P26C-1]